MSERAVIIWVASVVLLDGAAALVGGLLPDAALARWRWPMLGFAAGTLLASGLGDVLPDAVSHLGAPAFAWAGGAMLALFAFEHVTSRRSMHRDATVNPVALLGSDALHNFADGMAIAAAFLVSARTGVITSVAIIAHELPEELADYALLRAGGMPRRRALVALALVQLTAGLGAAAALVMSAELSGVAGVVLAIAAGLFIYLGAVDLLPPLVKARNRAGFLAFAAGCALAAIELL